MALDRTDVIAREEALVVALDRTDVIAREGASSFVIATNQSSDAPPDEPLERTDDRNQTRLSWKVRIRLARQGVEGNVTLTRKSKPNHTP